VAVEDAALRDLLRESSRLFRVFLTLFATLPESYRHRAGSFVLRASDLATRIDRALG
jgi:hypothetical protein